MQVYLTQDKKWVNSLKSVPSNIFTYHSLAGIPSYQEKRVEDNQHSTAKGEPHGFIMY